VNVIGLYFIKNVRITDDGKAIRTFCVSGFKETAIGAASGALWGTLIGLIFLMPVVGMAIGAASGAIGGKLTNLGIDDKFMKEAAAKLQSGSAVLFVLVRKATTDKVLERLKGVGGTVLRTSFDHTKEQELRDALADATAAQAKTNAPEA